MCLDYATLRRKLLLATLKGLPKFEAECARATAQLEAFEQIYTIAGREAATFHRR